MGHLLDRVTKLYEPYYYFESTPKTPSPKRKLICLWCRALDLNACRQPGSISNLFMQPLEGRASINSGEDTIIAHYGTWNLLTFPACTLVCFHTTLKSDPFAECMVTQAFGFLFFCRSLQKHPY